MQITLSVTAISASILALLAIILAYRAGYIRKLEGLEPGTVGSLQFIVAHRAHANLLENMFVFLFLLALAELSIGPTLFIACIAVSFILARLFHAVGYTNAVGGASLLRTLGHIVTWVCIVLLAVYNIVLAAV